MSAFSLRMSALRQGEGARLLSIWHTVTYLTSAIAFVGLFLTGELHPGVSISFCVAWIFGFFYRRPLPMWRQWMSSALTMLVIGYLALNVQTQFFQSLLTLLLYLVIAKSLMLGSPRDYLQTQMLCFFMLLATAVITVSFYLFFCLVVYLGFATLGFMLYSLTRPEDRAYRKEGNPLEDYSERVPRRFAMLSAKFTILIMALTVAFFIAIPHVSVQRVDAPFSSRRASEDSMVGYSDEVDFGAFKSLQPDPRIVLRIEPDWFEGQSGRLPKHLYLRGSPLETYDSRGWRRSSKRGVPAVDSMSRISLDFGSRQRGQNMMLRVHQNPDITKRIFTVPVTQEVDFGQDRQIRRDEGISSLQIASFGDSAENTYTNPVSYSIVCNVVDEVGMNLRSLIAAQRKRKPEFEKWLRENQDPLSEKKRLLPPLHETGLEDPAASSEISLTVQDAGASDTLHSVTALEDERFMLELSSLLGMPGEVDWLLHGQILRMKQLDREINVQLPEDEFIARIGALSREVAPGPSEAEIVSQLIDYFRTDFRYSLAPETPSGMHPIDAFLFETRMGHCEYFATAFVLMLRTRGIPARLINGFYVTEWNALGQIYIAKQSDAHAWAEVWLDGPGWLTLDPTSSDVAGRGAYGLMEPTMAEIVSEYMRIQWQRYVIDYSSNRQLKLFKSMRDLPGLHFFFDYRDRMNREMMQRELVKESTSSRERTKSERRRDLLYVLDGVLLILLVIGVRMGWIAWRRRGMRKHGYTGITYIDMVMRRARKYGRRRSPHETVGEFVRSLSDLSWSGADLEWLVDLYEGQRFGGGKPDSMQRRRAESIVRSLPKPERGMGERVSNSAR